MSQTLPAVYKKIINTLLTDKESLVLDLGCGTGVAAENFASSNRSFTGVDIYKPYIQFCRRSKNYKKLIQDDIKKFKAMKDEYDVLLSLQVIEHLKKTDAIKMLKKWQKIVPVIIVSTPNGKCSQHEYDGNEYQAHLSEWSAEELRALGFKVYGQGLKWVYSGKSFAGDDKIGLLRRLSALFSTLFIPIVYFYPELSAQLVAKWKK
jgi:2-polyprenyl-3-methyl-5-hydroxy-6-metoxy-1,4-benzoquinol methylase